MMTIPIATSPNNLSQDSNPHEVVPLLTPQQQVVADTCGGGISRYQIIRAQAELHASNPRKV